MNKELIIDDCHNWRQVRILFTRKRRKNVVIGNFFQQFCQIKLVYDKIDFNKYNTEFKTRLLFGVFNKKCFKKREE